MSCMFLVIHYKFNKPFVAQDMQRVCIINKAVHGTSKYLWLNITSIRTAMLVIMTLMGA